tara:strand:- start:197 stop:628 length:432 start_codon:yes stop_codon:yes gene_type:complete
MSTVETDLQKIRDYGLDKLYFVSYYDGDKDETVTLNFLTEEELGDCCDIFSNPSNSKFKVMDEYTLNLSWLSYKKRYFVKPLTEICSEKNIRKDLKHLFGVDVCSEYREKVKILHFDEMRELFKPTDDSKTKKVVKTFKKHRR